MDSATQYAITTQCPPESAALRLQTGGGRRLWLELPDGPATLEVRPVEPPLGVSSQPGLSLNTTHGDLRVTSAMDLLKALTGIDPGAGQPEPSEWLTRVALTHLPSPLPETLGWVSLAGPLPPDGDHEALQWLFRQGNLTLNGWILAPAVTLHGWLSHEAWEAVTEATPGAPIVTFCAAGHTLLPKEEMDALKVGDLITLETCHLKPDNRLALPVAGHLLEMQYHCNEDGEVNLELLGWREEVRAEAAEPEIAEAEEADCARLVFSFGQFELNAEDWLNPGSGRHITLPFSQPGRGNLIIDGHSRGYGELVAINDRLGVQILQLWGGHGRGN